MATKPSQNSERPAPVWQPLAHAATGAPVGLVLFDDDGIVLTANEEALRLLDQHSDNVLSRPLAQLFNSDATELRHNATACAEEGKAFRGRIVVQPQDGPPVDCDVSLYRVEENEGRYHVLWLNDVSEHAAMQRSLMQAERLSAMSDIVAGVAHELNNPLTGILGYAQLLLKDAADETTRQRLEHIINEAMRCEAVVQSLRGFSSRAASEYALHDPNRIVDNMVALLEYQMRVDGIEISRQFADDMPDMLVDAHALGRAVLNVVHNAQQALELTTGRERRFVVQTEATDDAVLLRFRDNGPGIRPEHLPRVFDPFFTTQEFGCGIGLGLSVAYGIVRDHGGSIEAQNLPGAGAEFVIRLPRTQ